MIITPLRQNQLIPQPLPQGPGRQIFEWWNTVVSHYGSISRFGDPTTIRHMRHQAITHLEYLAFLPGIDKKIPEQAAAQNDWRKGNLAEIQLTNAILRVLKEWEPT